MDENWTADVPAHWMPCFAVADCNVTAARVTEPGGQVCVPPTGIPQGRFAVVFGQAFDGWYVRSRQARRLSQPVSRNDRGS